MNLKECFLVAMEGIRVNKMRSVLTMLGIIIGVAAVITVVAIGQIFLDQGWYSMALSAKNTKTMVWSLIFGIFILWMPIPLISAIIFGHGSLSLDMGAAAAYAAFDWPLYFMDHFSNEL
jgi:hypothetical protein